MVDFLIDILIKLLFGPWFYLADHIPDIQEINASPKQLLAAAIIALPIVVVIRIRGLKNERSRPLRERIFSRILFSATWLLLIGALANSTVMVANKSRMPVFVKDHFSVYVKNSNHVIDKRHALGDGETKLLWLSDYIDDSSAIAEFFYPYSYSSPGDFSLAGAFIICWWLLVAIIVSWILGGTKLLWKLGARANSFLSHARRSLYFHKYCKVTILVIDESH